MFSDGVSTIRRQRAVSKYVNTASAMGDRQIFPKHTKSTDIFSSVIVDDKVHHALRFLDKIPSNSVSDRFPDDPEPHFIRGSDVNHLPQSAKRRVKGTSNQFPDFPPFVQRRRCILTLISPY